MTNNNDTYHYRHYVEMSTGASEDTKLNNIYDLAGNMYEWTTERGNHKEVANEETTYNQLGYAVVRGGGFCDYGSSDTVSIRFGNAVVNVFHNYIGFRVVLYVK